MVVEKGPCSFGGAATSIVYPLTASTRGGAKNNGRRASVHARGPCALDTSKHQEHRAWNHAPCSWHVERQALYWLQFTSRLDMINSLNQPWSEVMAAKITAKKTTVKKTAPAVEPQVEPKKTKGPGVGSLVKDLIGQGLNTDDILVKVKEAFPEAKTNRTCVSWYRSSLKRGSTGRVRTTDQVRRASQDALCSLCSVLRASHPL